MVWFTVEANISQACVKKTLKPKRKRMRDKEQLITLIKQLAEQKGGIQDSFVALKQQLEKKNTPTLENSYTFVQQNYLENNLRIIQTRESAVITGEHKKKWETAFKSGYRKMVITSEIKHELHTYNCSLDVTVLVTEVQI